MTWLSANPYYEMFASRALFLAGYGGAASASAQRLWGGSATATSTPGTASGAQPPTGSWSRPTTLPSPATGQVRARPTSARPPTTEVDPDRLVLAGWSFGGYLAPAAPRSSASASLRCGRTPRHGTGARWSRASRSPMTRRRASPRAWSGQARADGGLPALRPGRPDAALAAHPAGAVGPRQGHPVRVLRRDDALRALTGRRRDAGRMKHVGRELGDRAVAREGQREVEVGQEAA